MKIRYAILATFLAVLVVRYRREVLVLVTGHKHSNRLIHEKSPYLLQHAHNPVDWYPWGPEAFSKAKKENKLVFLSIGYSTCHWCHVMEHESFENEDIAGIMNENFVCIKVDREERPDVDQVYMAAVMAMQGQGGWPLSLWLTPDLEPLVGGTYFPPEDRWGRRGFKTVLQELAAYWKENQEKALEQGRRLAEMLNQELSQGEAGDVPDSVQDKAFQELARSFDTENGGFGTAPKFPTPHNLSFLMRVYQRTRKKEALAMVERTLDAMALGGLHDSLGGGFHRYSTDAGWFLPHFEKMLYDQALLATAYLEAFQVTGEARYADAVRDIFQYVLRDLRDKGGAFHSAEDADSEGYEGRFYLWTPAEVEDVLGEEEGHLIGEYYGVAPGGNFVTQGGHFEAGKSHLHAVLGPDLFADQKRLDPQDFKRRLAQARDKLFQAREKRVRPHKDDKVLAAWNGLMITALARGGRVLDEPAYVRAASEAAGFILGKMRVKGRLMRSWRDGEARHPAYAEDYAFLANGLLDLYEGDFDPRWLEEALILAREMIRLFWDDNGGGLQFSGHDGEKLIASGKELYDGATPSGNSVAALLLLRLAEMTGDGSFRDKAEALSRAFGATVSRQPRAFTQFLIAQDFARGPRAEIVVAGDPADPRTKALLAVLRKAFLPRAVILLHPPGPEGRKIEELAPFLKNQGELGGKAAAYVCENHACRLPVTDPKALTELLD